jgi:tetratricopeptide (TPR) repeat protein
MRYDRDGFPIPPTFDPPSTRGGAGRPDLEPMAGGGVSGGPAGRRFRVWKRLLVLGFALVVLVPGFLGPLLGPVIRDAVVGWSLDHAAACEARDDVTAAARAIGWALRWHGEHPELLCMRAMMRLESRDPQGAVDDADRAIHLAPLAPQPLRVRSLARVVLGMPDLALADANAVVEQAGGGDATALNHRAYIRGLLGLELEAALADVESAIASQGGEASPEVLDTRGFILHLLGRHPEAVDQMNEAIEKMEQQRRRLALLAGRVEEVELACRLRALDHAVAVMLHHRGSACRAMGLEQQAQQDLQTAERKGFDPTRGIF